ncbi:hypothetical protein Hanom_Chr04g00377761 [Helianthus anomalus]
MDLSGSDEACAAKDAEGADNIQEFSGNNDAVRVEISQMTSEDKAISDTSEAHLHTDEAPPNENKENTKGK